MSYVIGGFLPALLIGLALVFLKLSSAHGVGAGSGMMITGVGVFIAGLIGYFMGLSNWGSSKGLLFSVLVGLFWGLGTLFMSFSVIKFNFPMTTAAALAATNTLVVAVVSILFLGEGLGISLPKLILGAVLIVIGAILVTTA